MRRFTSSVFVAPTEPELETGFIVSGQFRGERTRVMGQTPSVVSRLNPFLELIKIESAESIRLVNLVEIFCKPDPMEENVQR
jgi:hypothetical protein